MNSIQISPRDNVAVALHPLAKGASEQGVMLTEDVQQGHKFALAPIAAGEPVIKYGYPIGIAKSDIQPGSWVHVHNVRTGLSEESDYAYHPEV